MRIKKKDEKNYFDYTVIKRQMEILFLMRKKKSRAIVKNRISFQASSASLLFISLKKNKATSSLF